MTSGPAQALGSGPEHNPLNHLDWTKVAPGLATLPSLLAHCRDKYADRELLVNDGDRITYAQAIDRSAALSTHLLAHGVGKGSRVGMLLPNGEAFLITWLAIVRIGAVAAPLSTLSTPVELGRLALSSGFSLLISTDRFRNVDFITKIDDALAPDPDCALFSSAIAPSLRAIWLWEGDAPWATPVPPGMAALPSALVELAGTAVKPSDPVSIIYTSGSTSEPKGVAHSHGNFIRSARRWAASMIFCEGERFFGTAPMFWVGGLIASLLTMMEVGGTFISTARTGAEMLDVIERERCTIIQVWPYMAKRIVDDPTFAARDFSAVRGGSVPEAVPEAIRSNLPFAYCLGMTETAGPHTVALAESDPEHGAAMGALAPGMEHRVVDLETGATLEEGARGELHVRGDTLMLGYEGRERTEVFDRDGWFATGDVCSIRDGRVYFFGRRDAMIKTSGANVSPGEVEAALLKIDGVAEAYVLGLPDAVRGQLVAALVVPSPGVSLAPDTLLTILRRDLSGFKVPRRLLVADNAPKTATNKLDRRAAIALLQKG